MGCLAAIIMFILIGLAFNYPDIAIPIGIVLFGLAVWGYISNKNKQQMEMEAKQIEDEEDLKVYKEKMLEYNIDENYKAITYKRGFAKLKSIKHYIWVEDKNLCFFPTIPQSIKEEYSIYKIPIENIEYYATQGSITKETKISGGGGEVGGSSIGGAIVGGVVAGGAGAVIGSRKKGKIEEIKSEIVSHDNRETFLNYFVDGDKHSMFFDFGDYTTLLKLLPQKEYSVVVNSHITKAINPTSVTKQLKELAELKESGIITEEEFLDKKKVLLDKIN